MTHRMIAGDYFVAQPKGTLTKRRLSKTRKSGEPVAGSPLLRKVGRQY